MKTALLAKLNAHQRERLIDFAERRSQEIDTELIPWRAKLEKYERMADNDFSDRLAASDADSVIALGGNKSLNLVRSVTRFMKGRCEGDIFGGEPFFFAKAEGLADAAEADAIQKHFGFKLRQADYRKSGKDAVGTALDLGTAIKKTTWKIVAEPYERLASVLHDDATGEPVLNAAPDGFGDYVEADHESLLLDDDGVTAMHQPGPDPLTGQQPPAIMGRMRERFITEPNVKYKGLSCELVPFRNVLFPFKVEKWEDADLIGHFYWEHLSDLKAKFDPLGNDPDLSGTKGESGAWHTLAHWGSHASGPNAGDQAPKRDETASAETVDDEFPNPALKIHELRLRFDANGEGVRRLYLVVHLESRTILHADYLGNITPNGDLDMHPIVINRVPDRSYGRGYYEVYEVLQSMIDGKLNAINHRNSYNADPIKVLDAEVTEETQATGQLELSPGKVLRKRKAADPTAKVLELIALPDLDERTWQLLELFIQILQQDSGVTAAAQGDPGALPSVATATGTQAILSSGSTMHQLVIDELREGLEPALTFAMKLVYARQDRDETFSYMEGSAAVQALLSLASAKRLRGLDLDVTLTLTRIKNQEQRETALAAINQFVQYFTLPPGAMIALRPLYIQAAKGFGFDNAESLFPLPQPVLPAPAPVDPNAVPAEGQPPTVGGSLPPVEPAPDAVAPPAADLQLPSILSTGAAPANPLPVNVIPAFPSANQAGAGY